MSGGIANTQPFRGPFCVFILGIILFFAGPVTTLAQRPVYTIRAELDTIRHQLSGTITIRYTNPSDRVLDSLGIHLWPNAYADRNTALSRQMLHLGNSSLFWAPEDERGGLSGLRFQQDSLPILLTIDQQHPDIGWLYLHSPLKPGSSTILQSPFVLTVPASFSRLGRTEDGAYQFTQWYPHLAVLDTQGWHTMPYLDQGEWFNDFADYEIHLRTPSNMIVAATGTGTSMPDTNGWTDWTFEARHVIDFAWFASSTWNIQSGWVEVGSKSPIALNVYTDRLGQREWSRAYVYAERALKFYSDWLGAYPYPQMSVVSTPLSRAGFMEYPMLAQISYTADTALLDIAIAHEIGHTWLYGILANNERQYPWMDEGLNTFLEKQYAATYQPNYTDQYLPGILSCKKSMDHVDAMKHIMRFNTSLDPPATPPEYQQGNQYYYSAYHLPAEGLIIIYNMVGQEKMKTMFRTYFNRHHFTHVQPEDMKEAFESGCACKLDWFFNTWLTEGHHVDYRIRKFERKHKDVTIVNKSGVVVPLKITAYQDGNRVLRYWIPGFTGTKIFHLDRISDEVRLYENVMMANTRWRSNVKPRHFWPAITPWPMVGRYDRPQISLTPMVSYTQSDGVMPGIVMTTGLLPQQNWKLFIAPLYSLESRSVRGMADIRNISRIRKGVFDAFLLSAGGRHFTYHQDTHYLFRDTYLRLSGELGLRIRANGGSSRPVQWWRYRYVDVTQSYGQGINFQDFVFERKERRYAVHELSWQLGYKGSFGSINASAHVQAGTGFVRVHGTYAQHFAGKKEMQGVWVRGFAGWLPVYDRPEAYVSLTINGLPSNGFFSTDYMLDEWFIDRNADHGLFAQQIFPRDAHLKTLATFGFSDEWMMGGGVSVALPIPLFHAYMDVAYYPSLVTAKKQLTYSAGVALVVWKDIFEVYVPLWESRDIRNSLTYEIRDQWYERISFQARFRFFHPLNLVDRLQFGW